VAIFGWITNGVVVMPTFAKRLTVEERWLLVNYIREYQIESGVPKADAYNVTMYIMAGLLFLGFLCNLMMRPVHERFHEKPEPAKA